MGPNNVLPPPPLDIPWRRRCVTENMQDVGGCDSHAPPRWQPSVAIFEYEPPPDQQVHPDVIVSYLKVTCTITGHTMNELSLGGHTAPYYYDPSVGEFLLDIAKQDACYGALVHVMEEASSLPEGGVCPDRSPARL